MNTSFDYDAFISCKRSDGARTARAGSEGRSSVVGFHAAAFGCVDPNTIGSVNQSALPTVGTTTMYLPHLQGRPGTVFQVRTASDPASAIGAIRKAVRQIDPNLPLMDVATQDEQIDKNLQQERVFAQAYAMFGGLAMLLAAVSLFGLMSYSVARRTSEIGIRMALGAQSRDVLRLVMSESMRLVAIGVAIGLGVAIAAGRLVASLLFGLGATDAITMVVATLVMVFVSATAGYLPARRASRVDPLVALHYE